MDWTFKPRYQCTSYNIFVLTNICVNTVNIGVINNDVEWENEFVFIFKRTWNLFLRVWAFFFFFESHFLVLKNSNDVILRTEKSCHNATDDPVSYFVNPSYPNEDWDSSFCDFRVDIKNRNVCQVRWEF